MAQNGKDHPQEEPFGVLVNRLMSETPTGHILVLLGVSGAFVAVVAVLTPWLHALRFANVLAILAFLAAGVTTIILTCQQAITAENVNKATLFSGGTFGLAIITWLLAPESASSHPVFNTPLSMDSSARPAIQVDILDDSEFLGTAELYLSVQSSRSPGQISVLFPLNRGEFAGCTSRFIQLPFEVADDDVLLLNLIDNDLMSDAEEQLILKACKTTGYCLAVASRIYQPDLESLTHPAFMDAAQVIGDFIVLQFRENPFAPVGDGEYIVQSSRPDAPNKANRISLLDDHLHVRAQVRLYFPASVLVP
jgi:hypothetical protein